MHAITGRVPGGRSGARVLLAALLMVATQAPAASQEPGFGLLPSEGRVARAPDPVSPAGPGAAAPLGAPSIQSLSAGGVIDLLSRINLSGRSGRTETADPVVHVRVPEGGRLSLALRACPAERPAGGEATRSCPHLELFAVFAGTGPNAAVEALNVFNRQAAGVKAFRLEDGSVVLSRYVTLNNGIAPGNVLGNVAGFRRSAERFRAFLAGPPRALAEPTAQIAVTNRETPAQGDADPAYAPDGGSWRALVNDPGMDGFDDALPRGALD